MLKCSWHVTTADACALAIAVLESDCIKKNRMRATGLQTDPASFMSCASVQEGVPCFMAT